MDDDAFLLDLLSRVPQAIGAEVRRSALRTGATPSLCWTVVVTLPRRNRRGVRIPGIEECTGHGETREEAAAQALAFTEMSLSGAV